MAKTALSGVRKSVLAGTWYPGSRDALRIAVDRFLEHVPARPVPGRLIGLGVPHAGHVYSGQVAAYAFKQLQGYEGYTIVLIGPSHFAWVGRVATTCQALYATPLGEIPVDQEFVTALEAELDLTWLQWDREHSLEIQLPFLQRVLNEFAIVPLLVSDQSWVAASGLGDVLARVIRNSQRKVILVASSDLSHYHSQDEAEHLDGVLLKYVEAYDPEGLAMALAKEECQACGSGAILAVMEAARVMGATAARVLCYATSGDVSGERDMVVGYAAMAFYQPVS